ncbi:VWA domain-containing protein [Geothermobacter hydrogeniphilus]|uniref:VWFA domain-containing protein n=1 Tax=Geothermobacter hydrogeniphilus TaxID=1969733 RepID=A0A1X0Y5I9_9BACT|nr:VWA domain-containing protein [Geothermobacter hydrogeniphilus]ORJ60470.1 hypothetical protein B5V00_07860 [Geothermobacter hydrogeniphilus]
MTWLLLPVSLALLLGWREWTFCRGRQAAFIRRTSWSRLCYDLFSLAALGLLMQPLPNEGRAAPRTQPALAVAVAIDVSPSMGLRDKGLSRLDLARQEVNALLDGLPGAQIALIPFAGEAVTQVPLTDDHQALRFFLRALQPGQVAAPGSAPEEALELAHRQLEGVRGEKAILLFSDGERTVATPAPRVANDIPVYAILPGDRQPRPVPGRTLAGQPAVSPPDPARLKRLAEQTGGRLLPDEGTTPAISSLLKRWRPPASPRPLDNISLLLPALLLLFLRQIDLPRKTSGALVLAVLLVLGGCDRDTGSDAGRTLFERGLKQSDRVAAARLFDRSAALLTGGERAAALHNACSSLVAAHRYRDALRRCETALLADPGADDSAADLSFAIRQLARQPAGDGNDGRQKRPEPSGNNRKLSAAEAREMLRGTVIKPFSETETAPETLTIHDSILEKDW